MSSLFLVSSCLWSLSLVSCMLSRNRAAEGTTSMGGTLSTWQLSLIQATNFPRCWNFAKFILLGSNQFIRLYRLMNSGYSDIPTPVGIGTPHVTLGDSAYRLRRFLWEDSLLHMTAKQNFNLALNRCRRVVENAFGLLKHRKLIYISLRWLKGR